MFLPATGTCHGRWPTCCVLPKFSACGIFVQGLGVYVVTLFVLYSSGSLADLFGSQLWSHNRLLITISIVAMVVVFGLGIG